jgi:hypothetical protein
MPVTLPCIRFMSRALWRTPCVVRALATLHTNCVFEQGYQQDVGVGQENETMYISS